jgi:membrane protein
VTPAERLLAILRWPILLVVVGVWLAVIYRYGPSRRDPKWRWVTWGSAAAAVLWLAASMLFSWYVANFDSYNKTYGSLGAGVGFMMWIWLSVVIVLLGAELNAETEHQTARDSTEGAPKPLGSRGANMADHVGASHA